MANDIFGGTAPSVSGITAEGIKMTFSTFGKGLVIQRMTIQYEQQISQVYALDVETLFLSAGRPQGRLELNNLVGPGSALGSLVKEYGNVCKISGAFNLSMATTCNQEVTGGGKQTSVTLNSPVITTVGISGEAQNFQINSQLQATFSGMQFN